jgi:hypothetical protein
MLGFWSYQDRLLERCEWAFAESVTLYAPAPAVGLAIVRGIFDTPPTRSDLALLADLSNQAPWVGFRVVELPGGALPEQGQQIEARGALWEIVNVQPDGGGHVRCQLFRVGAGSTAPLPPADPLAPIPPYVSTSAARVDV